jgi:hypothetical protein
LGTKDTKKIILKGRSVGATTMATKIAETMVSKMEDHVHSESCSHGKAELAEQMVQPSSSPASSDYPQGDTEISVKRKAGQPRSAAVKPTRRRRSLLRKFTTLSKRVAHAKKRLDKTQETAFSKPSKLHHHQRLFNKHMRNFTEVLELMKQDNDSYVEGK